MTPAASFRTAGALVALAVWVLTGACAVRTRVDSVDAAVQRALRFLESRQSSDGAWRSEVYGGLKDGVALTPPILKLLRFAPVSDRGTRPAITLGTRYLMSWVARDGKIRPEGQGLAFPVYAGALAAVVVGLDGRDAEHARARKAWLDYVLDYRLSSSLGWGPAGAGFGGWGYSPHPPRRPASGASSYEANLSATVFGIAALRQAGIAADDPVYGEIAAFVERCQNFAAAPEQGDPRFDDGGFFFTPCDPARNKAGGAGADRFGRERFNSYGSATADGLRALVRCGRSPRDPRVSSARRWLLGHFSAASNPGRFAPDREVLRDATYYYYAWSVAHAFMALDERGAAATARAEALAREIVSRQQPDGSWRNRFTDAKEDDPLVATPLAAAALVICRQTLEPRF